MMGEYRERSAVSREVHSAHSCARRGGSDGLAGGGGDVSPGNSKVGKGMMGEYRERSSVSREVHSAHSCARRGGSDGLAGGGGDVSPGNSKVGKGMMGEYRERSAVSREARRTWFAEGLLKPCKSERGEK